MNKNRPLARLQGTIDRGRRQATLGLLLAASILIYAQTALANTPTIRLFPTRK